MFICIQILNLPHPGTDHDCDHKLIIEGFYPKWLGANQTIWVASLSVAPVTVTEQPMGRIPFVNFFRHLAEEQLITLGKGKISEVRAGLRLVDKRTGERLKSLQTDADWGGIPSEQAGYSIWKQTNKQTNNKQTNNKQTNNQTIKQTNQKTNKQTKNKQTNKQTNSNKKQTCHTFW